MTPIRLPNGNLLVPRRAESDGVIGDAMVEIDQADPEFAQWDAETPPDPDTLTAALLQAAGSGDADALDALAELMDDPPPADAPAE